MKCPACGTEPMKVIDLHHVKVERCRNMKCRGWWFDDGELKRVLLDENELMGIYDFDLLGNMMETKGRLSKRTGPKGNELITITCPDTNVEIDVDPATGGVYLDKDEMKEIREQLQNRLETMPLGQSLKQLVEEVWEALKADHAHKRQELRDIVVLSSFLSARYLGFRAASKGVDSE